MELGDRFVLAEPVERLSGENQAHGSLGEPGRLGHPRAPFDPRMRRRGLIRDGRIGEGEAHLMKALDVIETTYEMTRELCPGCPTMPQKLNSG